MSRKIYSTEVQCLTIDFAKDVGLDSKGCVVVFRDDLTTRQQEGLQPLLIYSLVAPPYSVYRRQLVDPRSPLSISNFLAWAWSEPCGLGMPEQLEMKRTLMDLDLGFLDWIKACGVSAIQAASIKSITAFEKSSRSARVVSYWCMRTLDDERIKKPDLARANGRLMYHDTFVGAMNKGTSMETHTHEAWAARDKRFFEDRPIEADWTCALFERAQIRPNPDLAITDDDPPTVIVDGLAEVAAMWPGGRSALLKRCGIARDDFNFWLKGKADLGTESFAALRNVMRLKRRFQYEYWDDFEMEGGYLLKATTAACAIGAYNALSHGGDLRVSCELTGPEGEVLSTRFIVFQRYDGTTSIILFERGHPSEKALTERRMIHFQGPIRAPKNVWETVQLIVDRAEHFEEPESIGEAFFQKHNEWLETQGKDI